jgi:hypothetical protein
MYTSVYKHVNVYVYMFIRRCCWVYAPSYVHVCMFTHTQTHTHTSYVFDAPLLAHYVHTYTHTHTLYVFAESARRCSRRDLFIILPFIIVKLFLLIMVLYVVIIIMFYYYLLLLLSLLLIVIRFAESACRCYGRAASG